MIRAAFLPLVYNVLCQVGCQWGHSSETLRNVGLQWRGGVRDYNKTLREQIWAPCHGKCASVLDFGGK